MNIEDVPTKADYSGRWTWIKGYESLYAISDKGHVYSVSNQYGGGLLKPFWRRGSLSVRLSKNEVEKNQRVHRLVAFHFVDNPNNLFNVRHKDKDRKNNYYENLEFFGKKIMPKNYSFDRERVEPYTKKDKIIQIFVFGTHLQDLYGLSKSGRVYVEDDGKWSFFMDSPTLEVLKEEE